MYVLTAAQQSPYYWMTEMRDGGMGGMMGGNSQTSIQDAALPFFGFTFILLVGVMVIGVGGLAYYSVLPEIKTPSEGAVPTVDIQKKEVAPCTPLASVSKTLTDDERKVVDILSAPGGKYLQKYIRSEAGMSWLQTHRIVAQLAERGIVILERNGNTNKVLLADWLKN
jgi:predicted transcriptional regulator